MLKPLHLSPPAASLRRRRSRSGRRARAPLPSRRQLRRRPRRRDDTAATFAHMRAWRLTLSRRSAPSTAWAARAAASAWRSSCAATRARTARRTADWLPVSPSPAARQRSTSSHSPSSQQRRASSSAARTAWPSALSCPSERLSQLRRVEALGPDPITGVHQRPGRTLNAAKIWADQGRFELGEHALCMAHQLYRLARIPGHRDRRGQATGDLGLQHAVVPVRRPELLAEADVVHRRPPARCVRRARS